MEGRKAAEIVINLLELDENTDPECLDAFIKKISTLLPKEEIPRQEVKPISYYGTQTMRYGEYKGIVIDLVPIARLDWYLASAENDVKILGSYLNHPELEARRGSTA